MERLWHQIWRPSFIVHTWTSSKIWLSIWITRDVICSWMRWQINCVTPTAIHITSAACCCICLLKLTLKPFRYVDFLHQKHAKKPPTILTLLILPFFSFRFRFKSGTNHTCSVGAFDCESSTSMGSTHYIHRADQKSSLQILGARFRSLCTRNREVSIHQPIKFASQISWNCVRIITKYFCFIFV